MQHAGGSLFARSRAEYKGGEPTASLRHDRDREVPLYAASGVPEAWLADPGGGEVLAFRDPSPEGYGDTGRLGRGDLLAPGAFPDLELAVEEVLV